MTENQRKLLLAAVLAIATAMVLAACGSGGHSNHGDDSAGASGPGNATDATFVNSMIPHHEGAVEMARVARERGEHPEVKKLADQIISSQEKEIGTMTPIKQELAKKHGDHQMDGHGSMEMSEREMSRLESADPFDREFIDMMIPHHESAVKMAEEELAKGENEEVRALAQEIIDAQKREISQMRSWRTEWYGSAGAGGGGGEAGGHSGH